MLKLIIVEDDPVIAFDLKGLAESSGYSVSAVFHSAEDALLKIDQTTDLALLDVNLGDGNDGISLGIALKNQFQIPSIFITSYYDEKTVDRAKLAEPLAYILKPYEDHDILTNLKLAESKLQKKNHDINNKAVFVKSGSKLTRINPAKVDFVQAYDMYAHIYFEGKRLTASQTLKEVEKLFSSFNFMRVHRSFMVNLNSIDGICEDEILISEHRIPIGRTHKKELFASILTI